MKCLKQGLLNQVASRLDSAESGVIRLWVQWYKDVRFRHPVLQTPIPPSAQSAPAENPFWEAHAPPPCNARPSRAFWPLPQASRLPRPRRRHERALPSRLSPYELRALANDKQGENDKANTEHAIRKRPNGQTTP
jgi:hypothetical protein